MIARVFAGMTAIFIAAGITLRGQESSQSSTKRVVIDKKLQVLRAFEGDQVVIESRVSTGKGNSTPNGSYRVQGKQRMHTRSAITMLRCPTASRSRGTTSFTDSVPFRIVPHRMAASVFRSRVRIQPGRFTNGWKSARRSKSLAAGNDRIAVVTSCPPFRDSGFEPGWD